MPMCAARHLGMDLCVGGVEVSHARKAQICHGETSLEAKKAGPLDVDLEVTSCTETLSLASGNMQQA